jgi:hypothetical protein
METVHGHADGQREARLLGQLSQPPFECRVRCGWHRPEQRLSQRYDRVRVPVSEREPESTARHLATPARKRDPSRRRRLRRVQRTQHVDAEAVGGEPLIGAVPHHRADSLVVGAEPLRPTAHQTAQPVVGLTRDGAGGNEPRGGNGAVERIDVERGHQRDDDRVVMAGCVRVPTEPTHRHDEEGGIGRDLQRGDEQVVHDGKGLDARVGGPHDVGAEGLVFGDLRGEDAAERGSATANGPENSGIGGETGGLAEQHCGLQPERIRIVGRHAQATTSPPRPTPGVCGG